MELQPFSRSLALGFLLLGTGCTTTTATGPTAAHPAAYADTRLQYAVLTEDRETLAKEFRVNPERSPLERGFTALTLPFAAVGETVFWPVFYGLTYRLHE